MALTRCCTLGISSKGPVMVGALTAQIRTDHLNQAVGGRWHEQAVLITAFVMHALKVLRGRCGVNRRSVMALHLRQKNSHCFCRNYFLEIRNSAEKVSNMG